MDALTPLSSFLYGLGSASLVCGLFGFAGWRVVARLRRERPELFTEEAIEARRRAALPRELVVLERIAANQETMIDLLREVLAEKEYGSRFRSGDN